MEYKQIASYDNYFSANLRLGMLQENEINCHLKDEYIVTIDPLLNPAVGGIKLMVATDDLEKAKKIIHQADVDYVGSIPCPHCKSLSLVTEEKINHPETLWGRIKNQIAFGQTTTQTILYKCNNCGNIFTELPLTF